ncbi:multisubunit Na+/H+ antiporter MnhB subunit [Nocardioides zeae]|uniref:Multisubunit Na+/H+ antiporter MnhB subunit n=1 Tax=Nocardioides zeae TaxID=1457234 RepID=A0ACC6ID24_9ACTN|nr:multisubunit Na+/H+ antiporter MnhB subunit [Nocardioides zeae]
MVSGHLQPRWARWACLVMVVAAALVFAVWALVADGPARVAAAATAAGAVGAAVVVQRMLVARRQPVPPEGDLALRAPAGLVAAVLLAWLAVLVAAIAWVVVLATDVGEVGSLAGTVAMVLAALWSVPDLLRLVTGRLHRWRLDADGGGVHYRGRRTDVSLPWGDVRRVRVSDEKPFGVRIEVREGSDVLVPDGPLPVWSADLARALETRRVRAGRSRRT